MRYEENVGHFCGCFIDILRCQSCPKMMQKISQLMLQSPNSVHSWKIKTSHGNIVPIIHASLKEVCGNATLDRSTVQWWHKRFREGKVSTEDNLQSGYLYIAIDNTSIAIIATVLNKK